MADLMDKYNKSPTGAVSKEDKKIKSNQYRQENQEQENQEQENQEQENQEQENQEQEEKPDNVMKLSELGNQDWSSIENNRIVTEEKEDEITLEEERQEIIESKISEYFTDDDKTWEETEEEIISELNFINVDENENQLKQLRRYINDYENVSYNKKGYTVINTKNKNVAVKTNGERIRFKNKNGEELTLNDAEGTIVEAQKEIKIHRRSLVKINDKTAINIRAGSQMRAMTPINVKDYDDLELFRNAIQDFLDKDDVIQETEPIVTAEKYGKDSLEETVTMQEYINEEITELNKDEFEDIEEHIDENNIDSITELDVKELEEIGLDKKKAEEIDKFEPVLDKFESSNKKVKNLPMSGVGGSVYYRGDIKCGKDCNNCGSHGVYGYISYRDNGRVVNKYIG